VRAVIDQSEAKLELLDVGGARALIGRLDLELYGLILSQSLEAVTGDGRVMDEKILGTVIRRDEAEALLVIEPLHFSRSHYVCIPLFY